MKIQSLAIIFIIIILPISLVLSSYTKSRVETLSLQAEYDSKLNDSTFDALKAYQLNSFATNGTGDYTNSKIRDIEASVNTFFDSMSLNFSTLGYTKNTLQNFVPALVYTMYDGYYIYSPYKNTWNQNSQNEDIKKEMKQQIPEQESGTYKDGQTLYGLKPYVYYSARYIKESTDVVITYSLDNYIQIQGTMMIGGKQTTVSKYGYLLNGNDDIEVNDSGIKYKGILIGNEIIKENVYVGGGVSSYVCIKENGTKYYQNTDGNVFTVVNGKKIPQGDSYKEKFESGNSNAQNYYREAKELYEFITNTDLKDLTVSNIVNPATGKTYQQGNTKNPYTNVGKIFDFDNIESQESNFNTHRIDVIKNSIETNLATVINNFNNFSGASTDFRMPKLKESDWDTIMENISIISFMQGVNIGGKVYNGYSIISNNKNEDIVMPDSIYIKNDTTGKIHRITEENLTYQSGMQGIYNVNLEIRSGEDSQGEISYYFPIEGELSYESIVTQNGINPDYYTKHNGDLNVYVQNLTDENLKSIYYTALARERYGLYRQKLEIP